LTFLSEQHCYGARRSTRSVVACCLRSSRLGNTARSADLQNAIRHGRDKENGEVVKRKKKLSKKYYGTSHVLSKDEAKFVFESGCEQLILGSGQMGNVHLSPEAEAYFAKKGCKVLLQPTSDAIHVFNRSHAKKIGLFHVTC
jgi:hypothetical protein